MKYYVYVLVITPDGIVCYVGKGKNKRMYDHKRNLRHGGCYSQLGLYRRLRELIASGKDFKPVKVFETDNEEAAFVEERRLIECYGLENLFNSTTVCGPTEAQLTVARNQAVSKGLKERFAKNRRIYGNSFPPELRAKFSARMKQQHAEGRRSHQTIKWKKAGVEAVRGKQLSEEHRHALSVALTGKRRGPLSESYKQKIANALKGRPRKPFSNEHRLAISIARRGKPLSHECRLKISIVRRAQGTWSHGVFRPGR